jgi:hypothetical protein
MNLGELGAEGEYHYKDAPSEGLRPWRPALESVKAEVEAWYGRRAGPGAPPLVFSVCPGSAALPFQK